MQDDAKKSGIRFDINGRKGKIYRGGLTVSSFWAREMDRMKSRVRSKVEFVFRYIKVEFGYRKTRYRVAPHILCKPRLRWLRSTGAKLAFAPLAAN